jgi:tetratricopeptide (TPR) repeat protein
MRYGIPTLVGAVLALAAAEVCATEAGDFDSLVATARALNEEMAARTNGNLPLVDGLQDTDAHRAIWTELAPQALEHARKAHALRPDSVDAAATLANAYMFYASSLGIVASILKGASGEYREHANRLVEVDPGFDDGLGDYLLASFYLVAPWPFGGSEEALAHYERAAALSPNSARNQYGLGVYWAREGRRERARPHFDRVVGQPCTEGTERLFCGWMKEESGRLLRAWQEP